jgi:hypothetical protein
MKNYNKITDDDFAAAVFNLAKENIDETLMLPGIWEIISEHYNNEALDSCMDKIRESKREKIGKQLTTLKMNGRI